MNYNEYINNIISTRGQWNIYNEYYEVHHILPHCMGGKPDNYKHTTKHDNLIWLYPEEHYEAHKLLAEEYPDNKGIIYGWYMLSKQKGVDISGKEYKYLREKFYKNCSEINIGRTYSNEVNKKKSCPGEKNGMYGKQSWNHGKQTSDDTKNKISISNSGERNGMYDKYGSKHPRSKKIKDLSTGIVYGSMRECSRLLEIPLSTVYSALNNKNRSIKDHNLVYE